MSARTQEPVAGSWSCFGVRAIACRRGLLAVRLGAIRRVDRLGLVRPQRRQAARGRPARGVRRRRAPRSPRSRIATGSWCRRCSCSALAGVVLLGYRLLRRREHDARHRRGRSLARLAAGLRRLLHLLPAARRVALDAPAPPGRDRAIRLRQRPRRRPPHRLGRQALRLVPRDLAVGHVDDVFGDVGGVVGEPLDVARDEEHARRSRRCTPRTRAARRG